MSIEERKIAFLTMLWESVQDRMVGFVDNHGDRTFFPVLNATYTGIFDPVGNPLAVTAGSYDAAINRASQVGVPTLLVTTKIDSWTPALSEVTGGDNIFLANKATALTCTLPQNSVVAFPVNTKFDIIVVGAGALTIAQGAGATVIAPTSITGIGVLNARVSCWKIGSNLWHVTVLPSGVATGSPPPPTSSAVFTTPPVITLNSSPAVPGVTATCSDGVTNVTTTKVKNWWFLDSAGGFTGPIIQAGVAVTGNTYQFTDQDVGNTIFVKMAATPVFGDVLNIDVPGFAVGAGTTPAPSPPPAPGNTRGLTVPEASLIPSGPITAVSNQTISGRNFGVGPGVKITVPQGVTGVTIENNLLGSSDSSTILVQGGSTTIRNNKFPDSWRGILINSGTTTYIYYNRFEGCSLGPQFGGHAIENDYNNGITVIDSNDILGTYNTDAVSNFNTSRVTMTNNYWNINITLDSGAAFTMGDSLNGQPGRDNYIARNTVIQTGIGVPPGVFGSDGNTVMEYNCFTNGIQAYNYNGNPFVGVTIRYNVIGPGYFVQDTTVIGQWSTNIIGTDCTQVPAG